MVLQSILNILNAASLVELTLTPDFCLFPVGYSFGTSDGM